VHVVYPAPKMNVNPPLHKARLEKLFLNSKKLKIKLSEEDYILQSEKSIIALDKATQGSKINNIYIASFLKNNDFYYANNDEIIFYRDDNHLSVSGGYWISKDFVSSIISYIKKNNLDQE